MVEQRIPRDKPAPGANPEKKVGEQSANPLPDDYEERHPEDDAHGLPLVPEE